MATKNKVVAKKATPAKKASKPVAKPVAKAPAKKAVAKPVAKAPAKKTTPAKKTATKPVAKAPVKKVSKPVEKKAAPKKAVAKEKEVLKATKPVAEKAPAKKTSKPVAKVEAPKAKAKVVIPKLTTQKAVKYTPEFSKSILNNPANKLEKAKSVVRYTDADLQEFKEIILKKLDAAKKELAYLQGLITRRDSEGGDLDEGRYMTMEDGSISMEREQLSQLASRQIQFIDHLEKALMRVENKTYGICRVTGKLIDKARLRAVPHATLSIEAKSMINK